MTAARLHTALASLFRAGVLCTLFLAPTQWVLVPNPRLGPADVLLALTAAVWGLDVLLARDWRRIRAACPHWTHLLFALCAGAAVFAATDRKEAIKEVIQIAEYFIAGSMVFAAFLNAEPAAAAPRRTAVTLKTLFVALGAATAFALALAAAQYFSTAGHRSSALFVENKTLDIIVNVLGGWESPLLVGGTFGNRNVLGGYLALALPLCFAGAAGAARGAPARAACALLLLAGLTLNLSGASYWAVAAVLAAMAAARGARWFLPVAAALVLWQTFALPRLPRKNDLCHFESMALYDDAGSPTRRYPEWQAAASMILTNPLLGVGPGNYQKQVGPYYGQVPNATGPAEPDIQNLYLVLGASCGMPALLAFLALLSTAFADALKADRLGAAGALAAFALTAVWHPLLVRGIGLPLVFVLALARSRKHAEVVDVS